MFGTRGGTRTRTRLRVLIATGRDALARRVLEKLGVGFDIAHERVESPEALHDALARQPWDVVVCDPRAGEDVEHCAGVIRAARRRGILVIGAWLKSDDSLAAPLLRAGAQAALDGKRLDQLVPVVERELAAAHERRGLAIDSLVRWALAPLLVIDAEGRVLRVSAAAQALLGYSEAELAGEPIERLVPESRRRRHAAHRAAYMDAPRFRPMGKGMEFPLVAKGGAEIPVEISLAPLEIGGQVLVVCGIRDLRERLSRLAPLLAFSPDPMLVVDAKGRIVRANRPLLDLMGYPESELIGEPIERLVPEGLRERHAAKRALYAAAPTARPMGAGPAFSAVARDGSEIPVEISLAPVQVDGERMIACAVRDLRERRRTERLIKAVLDETAAETGEGFLRSLVRNLAVALEVRYAFISRLPGLADNQALVSDFWSGEGFAQPFVYALDASPCGAVLADGELLVSSGIRAKYPGYALLAELNAESFYGVRLQDRNGVPLGVLVVADVKPLADASSARALLRVFAARASSELERERSDLALRESEARFRALTELSSDYYWEQDDQLRFVRRAGTVWEKRAGTADAALGKHRWDLPALNLTEADWAKHRADLEARRPFRDLEIERPLPSGETRWIATSGEPIFDAVGRFRGYRGIGRDITAQKLAEQALRESEARSRALAELSSDWIWQFDEHHRFVPVGFESGEKAAMRPREIVGKAAWEFPGTNLSEAQWADFRAMLDARKVFRNFEFSRPSADGVVRWVSISGEPMFDAGGAFKGYRGTGRDISAQKRAEEDLRRFRLAMDSSADMILLIDRASMKYVDVNAAVTKILGYTREQMLAMGPQDILPQSRAELEKSYDELIANPDSTNILNSHYRCKDGSELAFESTRRVMRSGDGWIIVATARDIRERLAAERELREREARLRLIADHVPVMIAYSDAAFRFQYANRDFIDFYSKKGAIVEGRPMAAVLGAAAYAAIRPSVERALAGETMRYDVTRRRSDGVLRHVEVTLVPHREDGGAVLGVYTFVRDVTESRRTEAERERLLGVLQASLNEVYVFDTDTLRFQYVNPSALRNLGYSEEKILTLTPVDLKPEFDPASFRNLIAPLLAGKKPAIVFETVHRRADGSRYPVEVHLQLVGTAEDRVFLAIIFDITERRRTEADLRASEAQLRLITDSVPAMIAHIDSEYRYVYANRRYREFYTGSSDSIVGSSIEEILGPELASSARVEIARALAGESRNHMRNVRRRSDGSMRQLEVSLVPRRDEAGTVNGIYSLLLDVTRRRRAERQLEEREADLRLVVENVPAMICYLDDHFRYRYANQRYREFYAGGAVIENRMLRDVLGEDSWRVVSPYLERALAGETVSYSRRFARRDGSAVEVEVALVPSRDRAGRVTGIHVMTQDITERRRAEEALRLRTRAVEASVNSIMITEPAADGQKIVYVNPAFERITGYPAAAVLGRSPRFLHGKDADQKGVHELRMATREQREATALLRNYRKDGTLFWNELHMAPVRDAGGGVTHFIGVSSDVTDRIRYQSEIERQANYDLLTGLPNRNLLNDRLALATVQAERAGRPLGVMFIDLDHLKRINDSLGHAMGDKVIAATGQRIAETLRSGDTVARIGGDEFVVLLADLNREDDVASVATKLMHCVGAPLRIEAHEFVLSASMGIALYPKDGADGPTLLRNADAALYRAKGEGRDCFRFFASEMNERAVQFLALESDLRKALLENEFRLQYQPIVKVATGEIVGCEALVRWRRADGSMVPPLHFIPVAEESGLIGPIGRWVLETAACQAAEWNRGRDRPLYVSINLSAHQFHDPQLIEIVRAAVRNANVDPGLIKLELTESAVMRNAEQSVATLRGLKELGVKLAVDDFGTGYSSLAYLKRFPIDVLKIDRAFVRDLATDRDDQALSRAIIDLGRALELDVVAEGVETREQAQILAASGCMLAQGYLFGRPVDPEKFELPGRRGAH